MEIQNILSIIALFITLVGGTIISIIFKRAFDLSDSQIKEIKENIESLDETLRGLQLDIVKLQTNFENYKEIESLSSQLDDMDERIDHISRRKK